MIDDLRKGAGLRSPADVLGFRESLRRDMEAECKRYFGSVHTLALSNEHCHSRLTSINSIRTLHGLLKCFAKRLDVLVYLRRQDRVAVSLYSTALRFGAFGRPIFMEVSSKELPYYYDYDEILSRYSAVFDSVQVRLFPDGAMIRRDLLVDFLDALGVSSSIDVNRPKRINKSLSAEAQVFLAQFNRYLPQFNGAGTLNPRLDLSEALELLLPGKGIMPARWEAQRFLKHFESGNDRVRRTFFPERLSLFDDDFSEYPIVAHDAPQLSAEQAIEIAAGLWRYQAERRISLQNALKSDSAGKAGLSVSWNRLVRRIRRARCRIALPTRSSSA